MCRFNDTTVLNCAAIFKLFGTSLLNRSFAVSRKQLQFSQCIACHASASVWCSNLSDGILYIQGNIVKDLTKLMEIIIDFFFIWKKCDIMI